MKSWRDYKFHIQHQIADFEIKEKRKKIGQRVSEAQRDALCGYRESEDERYRDLN